VADVQNDMENLGVDSQSYDAQKPFKVFLSLLDRWEVGASLSDKLAVPALEAIRTGLPRISPDMRGEVSHCHLKASCDTDYRCLILPQQCMKLWSRSSFGKRCLNPFKADWTVQTLKYVSLKVRNYPIKADLTVTRAVGLAAELYPAT
jgi:hypothetical protein